MSLRPKLFIPINLILIPSLFLASCGPAVASSQSIPEGQAATPTPYSDFDKFWYGQWHTASEQERRALASGVIGEWNADWQSWRVANNYGEVYPISVDDTINSPTAMYTSPVARALPYLKQNHGTDEPSVIVVRQDEAASASDYTRNPLVLAAQKYMDQRQLEVSEPLRYSINIIRTGNEVGNIRYDMIIVEGKEQPNGINTESTAFGLPFLVGDGIVHVVPYEAILDAITKYNTASDNLAYSPNPADTPDGQAFISDVSKSFFDYDYDPIPPPTAKMEAYKIKIQSIFPGTQLSWRYNPAYSIRRDGGRSAAGGQLDPLCNAYTLVIDGYNNTGGAGLRGTLGTLTGMYPHRDQIPPLFVFAELEQAQKLVEQGIDPWSQLDEFDPRPKVLTEEDLGGLNTKDDRVCNPFHTVNLQFNPQSDEFQLGAWIGE